jgi:hypothetical protein
LSSWSEAKDLLLSLSLPLLVLIHSPTNDRHLDRSNGQLYRPLRSGETPVFRLCLCFLVVILREAEDLLLFFAVAVAFLAACYPSF